MKTRTFSFGLSLFLTLFLLVCFIGNTYAQGKYEVGDIVNNFTLDDMNGNSVSLNDYDGHVILLMFYAYW